MSAAVTLKILSNALMVLNGLISLTENSAKYRELIAKAIAENRDISDEEVDELEQEAKDAIVYAWQD